MAKAPKDPITAEARRMAELILKAACKARGKDWKAIALEYRRELIEELLAKRPDLTTDEARKRLAATAIPQEIAPTSDNVDLPW